MYALCVVYNPSNPHLALGPVCTLVADSACCAPIYMHEHWTVLNTDRISNIVTLLFQACAGSCNAYYWRIKTILHHPLPKYVHTINFMRITKCSPKWYCDGVSHMWRKGMAQRCSVNRQHCEFKVWVFMKSGSAVIDESFHNQFEWAPFTNGVAAEQGTKRPRHRWHRLVEQVRRWCPHAC